MYVVLNVNIYYSLKFRHKLPLSAVVNFLPRFLKARNWNRERELSDRDQLLSMRFTTNAEAAKGKYIYQYIISTITGE